MYPPIEHYKVWIQYGCSFMRVDRVLIPVCTCRTMLNDFRLVYTRIFIDNYPTNLFYFKMQTIGLYEYKVVGSGCGFNRKRGLAETDIYFIQIMLDFLSVCLGLSPPAPPPPHT